MSRHAVILSCKILQESVGPESSNTFDEKYGNCEIRLHWQVQTPLMRYSIYNVQMLLLALTNVLYYNSFVDKRLLLFQTQRRTCFLRSNKIFQVKMMLPVPVWQLIETVRLFSTYIVTRTGRLDRLHLISRLLSPCVLFISVEVCWCYM